MPLLRRQGYANRRQRAQAHCRFDRAQNATLRSEASSLMSAVMDGRDYETEFQRIFIRWRMAYGLPVPPNVPEDASGSTKRRAARNRLLAHLCFHARTALLNESSRLMPFLNHHLESLVDTVRTNPSSDSEEDGESEEDDDDGDVTMHDAQSGNGLSSAFNSLTIHA